MLIDFMLSSFSCSQFSTTQKTLLLLGLFFQYPRKANMNLHLSSRFLADFDLIFTNIMIPLHLGLTESSASSLCLIYPSTICSFFFYEIYIFSQILLLLSQNYARFKALFPYRMSMQGNVLYHVLFCGQINCSSQNIVH